MYVKQQQFLTLRWTPKFCIGRKENLPSMFLSLSTVISHICTPKTKKELSNNQNCQKSIPKPYYKRKQRPRIITSLKGSIVPFFYEKIYLNVPFSKFIDIEQF